MKRSSVLALSAAIGALAGLRTLTPPAVLGQTLRRQCWHPRRQPLKLLARAKVADTLTSMAASELVTDKMPSTPSRLTLIPMTARVASGALCGAAVCMAAGESGDKGAIAGAAGAILGAYAGYHLRQILAAELPDIAAALIEDAIAVSGSVAVASAL
ncbi:MAG TPA: DUF4126 family protein [Terriglobales bacterium]